MRDLKFLTPAHDVLSYVADDGRVVAVDQGRPAFAAILSANAPAPYEPPPFDLALQLEREGMKVSRLQARAALLQAGLLDQVERAINGGIFGGGTQDALLKMAWNEATEFNRTSPTIAAVAELLGLTDEAVDDLFRSAALIRF